MLGHRSWKAIDPSRANPKIARYALLFVVVALLAGFFRLSISNDPSRLLSSNSERFEAYASILQNFPGEQNQILIYTRAQAFAPDHLKAYKSVLTPLSDISGVAAVYSLYSSTSLGNALDQVSLDPKKAQKSGLLTDLKALLSQRDFMLSRLVSDEFDALLMAVTLSADAKPKSVISTIKTVLGDSYPAESGIVWTLAGNPVIAETLSQDTLWELLRVTAVAMIFGIGVACWFFKNLASVLQVVIVPTVAVACTLGAMAWLGISLNLLTQTVLVVVFLVVFTDSLHTVHGLDFGLCVDQSHHSSFGRGFIICRINRHAGIWHGDASGYFRRFFGVVTVAVVRILQYKILTSQNRPCLLAEDAPVLSSTFTNHDSYKLCFTSAASLTT